MEMQVQPLAFRFSITLACSLTESYDNEKLFEIHGLVSRQIPRTDAFQLAFSRFLAILKFERAG
jgi:hypothetical protein